MKVVASSDWRDGIPFETPVLVSEVLPGEDARCSVCGGDSAPRPRTELWAIKHRHPRHHDGYVRFYCSHHRPALVPPPLAEQPRSAADRVPRRPSAARTAAAAERPRSLCPDCFIEVPATGVCGMCGRTVA